MFSAELYKLRTHRTPLVCAAVLLIGVLAPSAVMLFYTPSDPSAYGETFTTVYQILAPLISIAFGGWLLGTEYRQDTAKRMLASEPRRLRALAAKATAGLAAISAGLAVTGGVGWLGARLVGSLNNYTFGWNGRELLAGALFAVGAAVVAFALSAITKSDSFAMVGTLALVLILDPLLGLIPKVGDYTFGSALGTLTNKVAGGGDAFDPAALSTGIASLTLTLWFAAFLGAGGYLFATRDI